MRPLTVGVNLCWLVPGVVGGSEDLLVGWLAALAEHPDPAVELTLFGPPALARAHPDIAEAFVWVDAPGPGHRKPARVAVESTWLAWQARRRRLDVMHHAGGVVPAAHPTAVVLTVHDLQPLDLPQNFSTLKRRYLGAMLPRSARAADVVTVTTEFVRRGVIGRLRTAPDRCLVVPPAMPAVTSTPTDGAALRRAAGIGDRYVLYPAIAYPHKNHRVLFDAMALLTAETGPAAGIELVLTGGPGPCDEELADQLIHLGVGARVHRLGRVARTELDALYAGALAVVFPSRYEGFGLPTLEAMAGGIPVIAATGTALSEVVGDGGVLVDPTDPGAWAAAIIAVAGDPAHRQRLVAAARRRASTFRAEDTAARLHNAYRAAAMMAPRRPGPPST